MVIQYTSNLEPSHILTQKRRMMFHFKECYVYEEKFTYRKQNTPERPSQRYTAICFYLMELKIPITNRSASGAS